MMGQEEMKKTQAIHSSLLTAILRRLDGVDGDVDADINTFEMLPLRTMKALNQLEAELVDENHLKRLVGLTNCVDM